MSFVYENKAKAWQLKRVGFFELYDNILYKPVKIPFESKCVQSIIDSVLNNPLCYAFFKNDFEYEDIYDESQGQLVKKVVIDDNTIEKLTSWRLQIDLSDNILGIALTDALPIFCDANKVIDKYCKRYINKLLEKKYIVKNEK